MPARRSQHNGIGQTNLDILRNSGPESVTVRANPPSPDKFSSSTLSWSISPNGSPNSVMSNDIPAIGAPSKRGKATGAEHSVSSFLRYQHQADNDSLLRVQVESSSQRTTFYVPVSLMLQREMEMQEAAQKSNIDNERWSNSRLFSQWKQQRGGRDEITLHLTPEESMKEFSSLTWKPWLTTCIRAYYNTGTIRIPDDCLGPDILLALEYFGILTTSPDTFVFDSYSAYERIKVWSAYFTHRNTIADWVLYDYKLRGGGHRIFVACVDSEETVQNRTLLQVQGERAGVLWGVNSSDGQQLSCKTVYELFSDKESESQETREMPQRMRQDFCEHVARSIRPRAVANFAMERVKITTSSGLCATEIRPTLRVQPSRDRGQEPLKLTGSVQTKESTGSDLARMIGLQSNASELYGSPSNDISTSISRIGLGGSGIKDESVAERFTFSPSSASHDVDGAEGMRRSIAPRPSMEPIEQRHPNRSSPEPDERRSSPELRKTISGPLKHQQREVSDKDFLEQIDAVAPLKMINTEYGDLGSVTSGLTGPFGDESTIGDLPSLTPALTKWTKKLLPLNDTILKEEEDVFVEEGEDAETQNVKEDSGERAADVEIEPQPKTGSRMKAQQSSNPRACDYWDRFLASMCEAVLPVGPQNDRSESPVRSVTIPTVSEADRSMPGDETVSSRSSVDLGTMARNIIFEATTENNATVPNCDSQESMVVEGAKRVGDGLTRQLDEFMKLALDTIDGEETPDVTTKTPRQPSKIPNNLPVPTKQKGHSRTVSNSSNGSRSKIPVKRNVEAHDDGSRDYSQPDLLAMKGSRNASGALRTSSSSKQSSERRAASSFSPLDHGVSLPPREPRRVKSKQNFAIARKKQSAQTKPPRHSPKPQAGVIPAATSLNSAKTLSTAPVKNTTDHIIISTAPSIPSVSDSSKQTATRPPTPSSRQEGIASVPSTAQSAASSNSKGSRRLFSFRRKK